MGAIFRLHGLHDQVLADDETHTLFAAGSRTVGSLLSTLGVSSFSPPLTALARALAEVGVPISELTLRLPTVLSGLALLVLAPLAVARRFGRVAATLFATLLAISPLLVIHSRHARPYLPALLLTLASLHAFHAGWFERRRRRLPLAAALGAAAVWVLPVVAPAVGAPWLVALTAVAIDRPAGGRGRWRELARSVLLGVALVTVAFAPAAATFERGLWTKLARSRLPEWGDLVRMLTGTNAGAVAATLVLAAAAGAWILARRRPEIALIAGAAVTAQVAALCLLRPYGFGALLVASRYLLSVLPLLLLGVAIFFAAVLRRLRRAGGARTSVAAVVALGGALLAAGPLLRMMGPARRTLSYAEAQDFVADARRGSRPPLPAAYRFVRSLRPRRVAVAPALAQSWFDRNFIASAAGLDRDLLVAVKFPKWARSPLARLETICPANAETLIASDAEAVILHRRPIEETLERGPVPERLEPWLASQARQAIELERRFRRAWGKPQHLDARHAVWNLRRVRRSLAAPGR